MIFSTVPHPSVLDFWMQSECSARTEEVLPKTAVVTSNGRNSSEELSGRAAIAAHISATSPWDIPTPGQAINTCCDAIQKHFVEQKITVGAMGQ